MIAPVITEKTMKLAGEGRYTFVVSAGLNKFQAKDLVEKTFGVKVLDITTVNKRMITKRNNRGRRVVEPRARKIVVKLEKGVKIDLFEEKKEK